MGLFDFVKGIGKKNQAHVEQASTPAATPQEPTAQQIANQLLAHVQQLGLGVQGLVINYNSTTDLATIQGKVKSQADKEKIVLAV